VRGWAGLVLSVLLAALAQASAFPAAAASPFADWAAVVVAGDFHAHSGGPTEAFDNARRDVATELQRLGFAPENVRTFSVRPQLYPDKPGPSEIAPIYDGLADVASRAVAGCLVYFTSHGAPAGVVLGDVILPPRVMNRMVDSACPGRPTIVVVSACFSGVFIPAMRSSQRMILTAARRDRTSFGCGESDRYPFFDDCFLSSTPKARDFAGLGALVQACVARKEAEVGASPPSEPQLWIGPRLRPILPLYVFPPG
jgi:hypothetical protein